MRATGHFVEGTKQTRFSLETCLLWIIAMAILSCVTSTSMPYWDGGRILFEIIDGDAHVPCAISRMALEEISEKSCFGKADLLASFASARGRIEKLALANLRARADGISGRLSLWADDLNTLPPGGASVATGRQKSQFTRRVSVSGLASFRRCPCSGVRCYKSIATLWRNLVPPPVATSWNTLPYPHALSSLTCAATL